MAKARSVMKTGSSPAESRFIEESGVLYEEFGLPRMAGRIVGLLLICDPPHQSLTGLGDALQASKGSISTMTRLLLQFGMIRRTTIPGDRRSFVFLPPGVLSQSIQQQVSRTARFRKLGEEGLRAIAGSKPERQVRLREMVDFHRFLEREMPALIERWERNVKKRK